MAESEIIYRDFWDVPRIFIVRHGNEYCLFDCKFNESIEDYESTYQVYLVPKLSPDELNGSWDSLTEKALDHLGAVPVKDVVFDETRRKRIDTRIIDGLRERSAVG